MHQLSAAGQIQLAQNACLLVGDGFAGGMQADILAENAEQDAAFRVRQRGKRAEQINWACGVTPRAVSRIVGMSTKNCF